MDELAYKSSPELAELIRLREPSPVELVESTLDRTERRRDATDSFATLCPDLALAAAKRAEQAVMAGDLPCTAFRSASTISTRWKVCAHQGIGGARRLRTGGDDFMRGTAR